MNTLEGSDGDVGNVGVQLVDAVLIFVAFASEPVQADRRIYMRCIKKCKRPLSVS